MSKSWADICAEDCWDDNDANPAEVSPEVPAEASADISAKGLAMKVAAEKTAAATQELVDSCEREWVKLKKRPLIHKINENPERANSVRIMQFSPRSEIQGVSCAHLLEGWTERGDEPSRGLQTIRQLGVVPAAETLALILAPFKLNIVRARGFIEIHATWDDRVIARLPKKKPKRR